MALPVGLISPLVAVLTVGISVPVTVGATLSSRCRNASFAAALRPAFATVGLCYLVGVAVVVAIAGAARVQIAAALVAVGAFAFLLLGFLPLALGRRLVARAGEPVDDALRFAAHGWPVAMALAALWFAFPSFLSGPGTHLLHVDGAVAFGAAVTFGLFVAVVGPGLVGVALTRARGRP